MDRRTFEDDPIFEVVIRLILLLIIAFLIVAIIGMSVCIVKVAQAETYTCVVHKGEWVWLRETPEPNGRQIGRVRYGYEVEADEPKDGDLAIYPKASWMLEGERVKQAYVKAYYFDRRATETVMRVNTQGGPLTRRETPSGRITGYIKNGVRISVLGWRYDNDGSLWAKVFHGGYVKAEFLTGVEQ